MDTKLKRLGDYVRCHLDFDGALFESIVQINQNGVHRYKAIRIIEADEGHKYLAVLPFGSRNDEQEICLLLRQHLDDIVCDNESLEAVFPANTGN